MSSFPGWFSLLSVSVLLSLTSAWLALADSSPGSASLSPTEQRSSLQHARCASRGYWVRAESASFFWQITLMCGKVLSQARQVTLPAQVLQGGQDRSVISSASEAAFKSLGSADKTWKCYPPYAHDSEFEADRSALDDDIAQWIQARTR